MLSAAWSCMNAGSITWHPTSSHASPVPIRWRNYPRRSTSWRIRNLIFSGLMSACLMTGHLISGIRAITGRIRFQSRCSCCFPSGCRRTHPVCIISRRSRSCRHWKCRMNRCCWCCPHCITTIRCSGISRRPIRQWMIFVWTSIISTGAT